MVSTAGLLERKKNYKADLFFRLNFNVYSDVDNRERATARNKKNKVDEFSSEERDENFLAAVRK